MEIFSSPDWENILLPQTPLLEIVLRGSLMYLALFLLMRMVLKRESGNMGITDLLVVVLLADAAQNGLAGDYTSVPDGILLVATILFWNYTLNALGYHFPLMQRLVHPPKLLLVEDGKMLHRNMRKEFITEDELMTQMRKQGIDDISLVDKVYMEGDGQISVIEKEQNRHNPPDKDIT